MDSLSIKSFAKINLSLDVKGMLADNFHEVETIMQAISLYDVVDVSWEEGENFSINLETNKNSLPNDEKNLAYKAAMLMYSKFNKNGKLNIKIEKKIPIAAGLAGGSSNAAAVILAINKLWDLNLNIKELEILSSELGSDIPFLVLANGSKFKVALGYHKGEKLKVLDSKFYSNILLVKPKFGVSTKEVYQGIDGCGEYAHPNTKDLMRYLKIGDKAAIFKEMVNVLENYTLREYKEVDIIKNQISETKNNDFAMMSGSGPTVVGFFKDYESCKEAALYFRKLGHEAYYCKTL